VVVTKRAESRRQPAGAAVLQEDVTSAIRAAVFAELAEVGYGRLSMESVARRAKVGKTALYRRWPSKREMVVAIASGLAATAIPFADTGSLPGDVSAFLREAHEALLAPMVCKILPDLFAEGARSSELGDDLLSSVRDPRRARAGDLIRRAINRGELLGEVDIETAVDLLAGPLYWRVTVVRTPTDAAYIDRLTHIVVAGIRAAAQAPDPAPGN
jgi:AcrR family transcriptional regulator